MARRQSPRAKRRALERARAKLAEQRRKLAALEPGGSAERPVDLESAALVEPRAEAAECLACGAPARVVEHVANVVDERRLRIATTRCARCGEQRIWYFRLVANAPS